MQIKFLPKLLQNLTQRPQRNPQQENENNSEINAKLNLLPYKSSQESYYNERYYDTGSYTLGVFVVTFIFILLLFVNQILSSQLDKKLDYVEGVGARIAERKNDEEYARNLEKVLDRYKSLSVAEANFSEYASSVYLPLKELGLVYSSVNIDHTNFDISLEGKSPYVFSQLINKYLSDEKISKIILSSASFDMKNQKMKVMLKGEFK